MTKQEQIALAAKLLNLTTDEVQANSDIIPELSALYVSIPIKSGESLIVGNDGQVLYADSSIGYTKHLEAYKEGKRTPIESFNIEK